MSNQNARPGRFFITSFPEAWPRDSTVHFILENNLAGLILFGNHCENPDDLKGWLRDLKKEAGIGFLVAIDQEGGRVRRLKNGFPYLEAPRYYGHHRLFDKYRSDLARTCDRLRELGINYNLVPTVDLFDEEKDHVLDSRTFGDDIDIVNEFARITIEIHHEHGLLTSAKHFPGLGRSYGDPHNVLAVADINEDAFKNLELQTFEKACHNDVDSIMVTHLEMPRVDDKSSIISSKVITDWAKIKLNFAGPIITDDLLMTGADLACDFPCVVVFSFKAGSDLLLFGTDLKKTCEALEFFESNMADGQIDESRLEDADRRRRIIIDKLKSWY